MFKKVIFKKNNITLDVWNNLMYNARSLINDSPFTEILSPEVGTIIIEVNENIDKEVIIKSIKIFLIEEMVELNFKIINQCFESEIKDFICNSFPDTNDVKAKIVKELKINIQSEITVYPHYSLYLCVILSQESLYPWFYEHFIQIVSYKFGGFIDYIEPWWNSSAEYCHYLFDKRYTLGHEQLKKVDNIINFIIENINAGMYVYINVDEFYLPGMSKYKKTHFVHQALVYGYDNVNKRLMVIRFDPMYGLSTITFNYDDFYIAYERGKLYYMHGGALTPVELFNLKEFSTEYPFDLSRFLDKLKNYIFSRHDSSEIFYKYLGHDDNLSGGKYGFDIYDEIIKWLESSLNGNDCTDYRAFHFLYEHKKGIYSRLQFISSSPTLRVMT